LQKQAQNGKIKPLMNKNSVNKKSEDTIYE